MRLNKISLDFNSLSGLTVPLLPKGHTLQEELKTHSYKPGKARKVKIPKADGKSFRELSIPSIRDRIVQGAVKLILEPIFEADFKAGSYGYRPKRATSDAIKRVSEAIVQKKTKVIDLDIAKFFDTVKKDILLKKVAKRLQDPDVLHLLKMILQSNGKHGLFQGGPLSPLLSNIYLTQIDEMLERMRELTKREKYYNLDYARWADDLVILVDQFKQNQITRAVIKNLHEEFEGLGLSINQEKTNLVDLRNQEKFSFLGFDFRLSQTRNGKIGVRKTPKKQARVRLQQSIKEIFKEKRGRPIKEVVSLINPILAGWVNYFRIGNSNECFNGIKSWVEKKVRRHICRNKKKSGFGWKRWSSQQLHQYTGLYNDYRIRYNV